jgi:O-antigen/teichoic acid export membrane protein
MLKPISYSIGTQALTSAGNFIITLAVVRLISVEAFGLLVNVMAIASVASALVMSIAGSVYIYNISKFKLLKKGYEKNFNGFLFMCAALVAIVATVVGDVLLRQEGMTFLIATALFVFTYVCVDNLRLQTSANGGHVVMFYAELFRQLTLIVALYMMQRSGDLTASGVLLAQSMTNLGACMALVLTAGTGMTIGRIGWLAKRHLSYGMYLLPSTLIGTLSTSGIQIIVGRQFGFEASGALRLAEMPFSALNPLKQSLIFFFPRLISKYEQREGFSIEKLLRSGVIAAAAIALLVFMAWGAGVALMPKATAKEYPVELGVVWAIAYFFIIFLAPVQIYLNHLRRPDAILKLTTLGALVSLVAYFSTCYVFGVAAAAIAAAVSFAAMCAYGVVAIVREVNLKPSARGLAAEPATMTERAW